ncbi:MAG: hypothetical protein IPH43_02325 [Xanthomonadales bacterium]|nr:hypothetical protein [Xanthomonadales bacterium]
MVDVAPGLARAAPDAGKLPASSTLAAELAKTSAGESAKALISQLTDASASVVILAGIRCAACRCGLPGAAAKFIARATGSACNDSSGANAIGFCRCRCCAPRQDVEAMPL